MGNSFYCEQCHHKHQDDGLCCGRNYLSEKCPDCHHRHLDGLQCCEKTCRQRKIEKERKIPCGVEEYTVYEDFVIGSHFVLKDVEDGQEPYDVQEPVPEWQQGTVKVTKTRPESYTDYSVPVTTREYSPYEGMNGNVSYRLTYPGVQRTRDVQYDDWGPGQVQVQVLKNVTHYRPKFIKKEVEEPITERRPVVKTRQLYKTEKYTEYEDVLCACQSVHGCRCVAIKHPKRFGVRQGSTTICNCVKDGKRGIDSNGDPCWHVKCSSDRTPGPVPPLTKEEKKRLLLISSSSSFSSERRPVVRDTRTPWQIFVSFIRVSFCQKKS